MSDLLEQLKEIFAQELAEAVENIEQCILKFERDPFDTDIINELFRYFHNIKGSSRSVGYELVGTLTHEVETILSEMRTDQYKADQSVIDAMLKSADMLRQFVEEIDAVAEEPVQAFVNHLQELRQKKLGGEDAGAQNSSQSSDQPEPTAEQTGLADQVSSDPAESGMAIFDDDEPAKSQESPAQGDDPTQSNSQVASPSVTEEQDQESAPQMAQEPAAEPKEAAPAKAAQPKKEFIRVPLDKINSILELFGEQIILQSSLEHALSVEELDRERLQQSVSYLIKITQALQGTMVTLRMIELKGMFAKLERVFRDTVKDTGKNVQLDVKGGHHELDKSVVEALSDPLTHIVRNAVDHGIELTEEDRVQAGKSATATVTLHARRSGGNFEIKVKDDGRGLNYDKILEKAKKLGFVKPGSKPTHRDLARLIFESGFSTAAKVTNISGRGVGMDVVRRKIESLKGQCLIESVTGSGTEITVRVPLSLAMFNGIIVVVNGQRYVMPNSDFSELVSLHDKPASSINSKERGIHFHGRVIPIIDMSSYLQGPYQRAIQHDYEKSLAVITERDGQQYALLIHDVIGQEQIVLKELDTITKSIMYSGGGTILGDGHVALILDVDQTIKHYRKTAA